MANVRDKRAWGQGLSDQDVLNHIVVFSTAWALPLLQSSHFLQVRDATIIQTAREALSQLGPVNLVVRNVTGSDLGLSNRHWNEQTSGSVNAWEDSDISSNAVADQTFIGLFGLADLGTQGSVSGVRITVGGARVREWDLQHAFNPNGFTGSYIDVARYLIADEPLTITQNQQVTVSHYPRGATNTDALPVELVLLGVTVEPEGSGAGITRGGVV